MSEYVIIKLPAGIADDIEGRRPPTWHVVDIVLEESWLGLIEIFCHLVELGPRIQIKFSERKIQKQNETVFLVYLNT